MQIIQKNIAVRELTNGYINNGDEGVYAFNGQLCCRPPYQREFVYKPEQQQAVIDTILKGFPLNVMYWSENEDGSYELLDGQQRTLSICSYVSGGFSFQENFFHNLPADIKEKILNYELFIYICKGEQSEKLGWFRTINIAGERLTDQELLNANYTGKWLTDAKRYFSKNGCPAYNISKNYFKKSLNRQELLETALIMKHSFECSGKHNIAQYMAEHQHDNDASDLWIHFKKVCDWVETLFPTIRKEMLSVDWGELYRLYHERHYNPADLENEVTRLMKDSDVTKKSGIYRYVLGGDEKYLSIRAFDDNTKRSVYEKQGGICPICGEWHDIKDMEADHVVAWANGGKTTEDNCQMLCQKCNREKGKK